MLGDMLPTLSVGRRIAENANAIQLLLLSRHAEKPSQTKRTLALGKITHSLRNLGVNLDASWGGNRADKKCFVPCISLLKLGAKGFQNWDQIITAPTLQAFEHGDRPRAMRPRHFVTQSHEHLDMLENLLSPGKRLLGGVGQSRNVAFFHVLFQFLELRQILVDFKKYLGVGELHELR